MLSHPAGVPRVFTDRPLPFDPTILDTCPEDFLAELARPVHQQLAALEDTNCQQLVPENALARNQGQEISPSTFDHGLSSTNLKELLLPVLHHMHTCRVNISIRAVR